MSDKGKVYPALLTREFAVYLLGQGKQIEEKQDALDVIKWSTAESINLEWEHGDYKAEKINKRDFYISCCTCLPVKLFGKSGETLRRWCETQAHFEKIQHIEKFLHATSFDHLLKAKRLEQNKKAVAVYAVAKAIENEFSADEMVNFFDPEHDGIESKNFKVNQLFSLSEAAWIPKEAAEHILTAAKIIKESLKNEQ